jgi:hypothetical protein
MRRNTSHFIWSDNQSLEVLEDPNLFPDPDWCAMECCGRDEETCYEYDQGYLKPFTKQYCKAVRVLSSSCIPCLRHAQIKPGAIIYSILHIAISNSQIADGGCPCPTGQEKCGAGKFVGCIF